MIYPNSDLKFRITSNLEGMVLKDIDFSIDIKNKWGQLRYSIPKDECFQDSEGEYVFTVENVKNGLYFAYFSGLLEDYDFDKMLQCRTDIQELYAVGSCGAKSTIYDCEHEHIVKYERVTEVDIDGATYLADKDGNLLLTSDGRRIQLNSQNVENMKKAVQLDTLTGDEFKALLEQVSQDGKINTIPELIDFLSEVPQGMSLKEYIESIAGGGGSTPAPDSVGSEQIKDDSIEMEDLSKGVKDSMLTDGNRVTQEELDNFEV